MADNLSEGHPFPTGAKKPSTDVIRNKKLSLIAEGFIVRLAEIREEKLAGSVNYISQLPPIKNQGDRGTCVAFVVTGINEFFFRRQTGVYTDLSEQYLFFETKQQEGDTDCNSLLSVAVGVIGNKGQCTEEIWSYNPDFPCIQTTGKPADADNTAQAFRNNYVAFPKATDLIVQLKKTLVKGHLIAFTLPLFVSWYNVQVQASGRIPMPGNDETPIKDPTTGEEKGHALMIIGYQDNAAEAGGGHFIVRNSWGPQWGTNSFFGPGYGTISYDFLSKHSWEIFAGPV